MPLPLILIGASALAGGFGVTSGITATSLFKSSKLETLQAEKRYISASKELDTTENTAGIAFEVLGNKKIEIYNSSLIPFVEAFSLIKNVDYKDGRIFEEASLTVTQADMLTLLDVSLKMKDVIATGVGCLGGGGLTVLAAYGGTGLLGAASAGTVFSGASGAATTTSALACLGGGGIAAAGACVGGGSMVGAAGMAGTAGSMAGVAGGMAGGMGFGGGAGAVAGGMGMGGGAGAMASGAAGCMGTCGGAGAMAGAASTAGGIGGGVVSGVAGGVAGGTVGAVTGGVTGGTFAGMAALGGMIAGPFLAVGGMVLASKAKKAKADAATNITIVNAAVEQMKNKQVTTSALFYRAYAILSVLCKLEERFTPLLAKVQGLVASSPDYTSYNDTDKKAVMMAAMLAKTIKNVMETSILDDNGMITSASGQIVEESECVMQAVAI